MFSKHFRCLRRPPWRAVIQLFNSQLLQSGRECFTQAMLPYVKVVIKQSSVMFLDLETKNIIFF